MQVKPEISQNDREKQGEIPSGDISILKDIRIKYAKNVIIGHLNINFLAPKFQSLKIIIQGMVDVLVIVETKLDDTFPEGQFEIDGFKKPFRLDRNKNGGGIMIYVREDIPCKPLKRHTFTHNIEAIFLELNLRKTKLLLMGTYHSTHPLYGTTDTEFFEQIGLAMDVYCNYDRFLLAGDFNIQEEKSCIKDFLDQYDAKNMVKENTCYKSMENPSCIDLLITNKSKSFQNTVTVSTGLSDYHKMTLTVMKTTFEKQKPKTVLYRDFSKYSQDKCFAELKDSLVNKNIEEYEKFEDIFLEILETNAPHKKKVLRANHKPYVSKPLRKAIMKRSQLENKYYKNRTPENKEVYKKQKNYCSRLLKREKSEYYSKLDLKNITDNKKFWKTMKPLFSDKLSNHGNTTLVKNKKIISEDGEVAQAFNDFFENAVKSLEMKENSDVLMDTEGLVDPVEIAIKKFEKHPSIQRIQEQINITEKFSFKLVSVKDIENEIRKLSPDKANTHKNIPIKVLKEAEKIVSHPLMDIWNKEMVGKRKFSIKLKLADIKPIHKKLESIYEKNYRPISILPVVSKIFERIMDKQMNPFVEKFLSPYISGYRKGHNAQYALTIMIEKWKQSVDNGGYAGGILTDLSKAFDTINHELLIAKMHAYGFDKPALSLISDYLSNRWQRTKINLEFSTWSELLRGMPQGSVLGPKFFNVYTNDLFYEFANTDICNLADDTTPYACDQNIENFFHRLEYDIQSALIWYEDNYMKTNEGKCHFLFTGITEEHLWAKVGGEQIWESNKEILLGLTIDKNMKFDQHLNKLCKKASGKVSALARMARFLTFEKKRVLMSAFIESQFSYCPLIWMFCSCKMNRKMNHIHERALRIAYSDYSTSFEILLQKDRSVTIHHKNIQKVAVEMYKAKNNISPNPLKDLFKARKNPINTRMNSDFYRPKVNSVYKGDFSLRSYGPIVWNEMLPKIYKECNSLDSFKDNIKNWVPTNCPCKLCKTYKPQLGYVNLT